MMMMSCCETVEVTVRLDFHILSAFFVGLRKQYSTHRGREIWRVRVRLPDDVHGGGDVLFVVDTHDEHWSVRRRCRDNDLLSSSCQVSSGLVDTCEAPCRLYHVLSTISAPWDLLRVTATAYIHSFYLLKASRQKYNREIVLYEQAWADPDGGTGGTCQWRIQLWAVTAAAPPPIDQNLGLVMAARLRHGGKFSLKSLTFGHFFV